MGYPVGIILQYQTSYFFHLLQHSARRQHGQLSRELKAALQQARNHLNTSLSNLLSSPSHTSKEEMRRIDELCLAGDSEHASSLIQSIKISEGPTRFDDAKRYCLYCLLRLLQCMTTISGDGLDNLQELHNTARILLLFCVVCFNALEEHVDGLEPRGDLCLFLKLRFVRRPLLWVSLILTKSTSPGGNTPYSYNLI
jgi:hypothetical protein